MFRRTKKSKGAPAPCLTILEENLTMYEKGRPGRRHGQRPLLAHLSRTAIDRNPPILLKKSNIRIDHNLDGRWQPRWKIT